MTLSIRRTESQIELSDSGVRYRRSWRPPQPHQAMILVHGYAEHSGRYDEMAMFFARHAFAVHTYDQAGHGRTPGPRGHIDRFDRLFEELARFIELVALEEPGLPIILVGHSMGGLVAAETLATHQAKVDLAIFSGALLELSREGAMRRRGWAARLLGRVGGRISFSAGLDSEGLSRDLEVRRRYLEDPYVMDRISARFAAGMMKAVRRGPAAARELECPVLLLHGGSDPISPPNGSLVFRGGLPEDVAPLSALKIYPTLRHEIFQEPERERVWRDMLNWLADPAAAAAELE